MNKSLQYQTPLRDSVAVNVDRPTTSKAFTYRMVVTSPTTETANSVNWFNGNPDCPVSEGTVALPWVREETIEMPFESSDPREWCGGIHNEIWVGCGPSVWGHDATVEIFLNDNPIPFASDTDYQYPLVQISAYWDGDPDHDIVFQVQ
jgi:hypothetical protein